MPFCDLEEENTISVRTTTAAAVDDTPMTPTINYDSMTSDYPVTVGGWIYYIIWIMFQRLVLLFCFLTFNIHVLCGELSYNTNILH